jgi:hypothetical protein
MNTTKRLLSISLLLLTACITQAPDPEWPTPDANFEPSVVARCPDQCERLRTLCPGSYREDCSQRCETLVRQHLWSGKDVKCVIDSDSVDSARKCRTKCAQ